MDDAAGMFHFLPGFVIRRQKVCQDDIYFPGISVCAYPTIAL